MVVQQHVLNWLYSVLTSEYHDVNRTYNDVAQVLSAYPSLSPRTDVHTFDNGVSALLVHVSGTIPVVFRGTTYRFPISLWVPHSYPREAPIAYVTPTENMVVRPGQHIDPQGRIYHPYLVGWVEFWDKSSILDFLAILRDVFAKEPPVVARQPPRPAPQQLTPTPPPIPPLPQEISARTPVLTQSPHAMDGRPPPPPPKEGSDAPQVVPGQAIHRDGGPPLPPLPPGIHHPQTQYSQQQQSNRSLRYDSAPPLPFQQGQPQGHPQGHPQGQSRGAQPQQHQQPPYMPPGPQTGFPPQDPRRTSTISPMTPQLSGTQQQQRASYGGPAPNWQPPMQQPPPQPQHKPPPPPDIMDEPLTLALPSPSHLPPPPIPPNPEKDALLRQLASTLYTMRQRSREQNKSSLAGLTAQRNAMLGALQNLQNDSNALTPLSAMLASNTSILQQSLQEADGVISNSRKLTPPGIDELLVAPTVVGNQLYDVVADERALGDAIFILGRAVERGRITPAVFAKTTRSLAREWYLKKALARKIGKGMGLAR
ncbi:UEV domain-containing protein [Pseudomassariella vexata]|uniref:UEV domain-domain-containing protein n=1 Tax=Pseudomassariella vexata TaxID=1141098 RepID=A0A1Y2DB56_9PEZI|nr:UEV domain-containing protein [Pseudomassariella vexata]ORY56384.1 UEV domain-domain-containing protein [Pseudomassariella vexata]